MINIISETTSARFSSISGYSIPVSGVTIQSPNSSVSDIVIDTGLIKSLLANIEYYSDYNSIETADVEFAAIRKLYTLINENELKQYLEVNSFLYSVLIKAVKFIENSIGIDGGASLELYTFFDDGSKAIFLSINSSNEDAVRDDIEDIIINEILSYSSKPLDGRIVVSVSHN